MGDGAIRNKGLTLCTDSFSFEGVVVLMNILKLKFDLNTSILLEKGKPRIYISLTELNKVRSALEPYIVPSMKYKLNGYRR